MMRSKMREKERNWLKIRRKPIKEYLEKEEEDNKSIKKTKREEKRKRIKKRKWRLIRKRGYPIKKRMRRKIRKRKGRRRKKKIKEYLRMRNWEINKLIPLSKEAKRPKRPILNGPKRRCAKPIINSSSRFK